MKKGEHEASKLKKILFAKKREGVKEVVWRINSKEKLEYLQHFFEIEPMLYEIKTKTFFNISAIKSPLLKDIHYAKKRGKNTFVTKLKQSDRKLLEDYGIYFRAIKYKIKLY